MNLKQIKCPALSRVWNLSVSDSYVIGGTGKKVIVLDRALQPVRSFVGLDYVYTALALPDETRILMISTGNKFCIGDMESGR